MPPLLSNAVKFICKGAVLVPLALAANILPVMAAQKFGDLSDAELERGIKDQQGRLLP